MILKSNRASTLIVQLNSDKPENPFSREMTKKIIALTPEINQDAAIKSVVFYGGENRSFSVGGDFRDIQKLQTKQEIEDYLLEIIDLYIAVLKIEKPTVMALDKFAIGQGLQFALMGDWRVANEQTQFSMPELKNGVACPLGASILEKLLGRAKMFNLVIGCASFNASKAVELDLIQETVLEKESVLEKAMERAVQFENYPETPYRTTKKIMNATMIKVLDDVREAAALAHSQSFLSKSNQNHFDRILKTSDKQ